MWLDRVHDEGMTSTPAPYTYVSNNEKWIAHTGATGKPCWVLAQRNVGYADNDGRWTAQRVAGNRWSSCGILESVGTSAFLGVFATEPDAVAAITVDRAACAADGAL